MSKLRVKDSGKLIEIQNVYCVGKNYLEHIKEFESKDINSEIPTEPVIFLKPNTAVETEPGFVKIPDYKGNKISGNLQNEVELVIVISKDGRNISEEIALEHVYGYAVGIDFTLRDIQSDLKQKGLPWTLSKGFLKSGPVSLIVKRSDVTDAENLPISLKVNGETRQNANTSEMLFKISYLVHYISSIFGLKKGDLIFTGTPAGISKLNPGDNIIAEIDKIGKLSVRVE